MIPNIVDLISQLIHAVRHINFEKVHTRDKSERYRAKIVTERNDTRLNRHQRLQLQGWRANCDINVVIDYHSCIEYLTKYALKAEKLSNVARDAFVFVVNKLDHQMNGTKAIKQLMMKAVGERDMSAQEVMHQFLSLKLYSSSYHVITTSLNGSRKFHVADNTLQVEPSLHELHLLRVTLVYYAGINLTGYHPPLRADCRATNFFRQNPRPRDSFSVQNSGPQVGKNETKSPPPGIICLVQMPRYQ